MLVALIGPMGVGKTTIGKIIANSFELAFFDLDAEIEKSTGVEISRIFDVEGESGFRSRETRKLEEIVSTNALIVLSTGGGVVKSAVNRKLLANYQHVIYLSASADYLFERLRYDTKRPLLAVDDPKLALENIINERHALYLEASTCTISVIDKSAQQLSRQIINIIQND